MAVLAQNYLTLADALRRGAIGDQQVAEVIEMLSELNPVLEDAVTVECNMGTKHRHNIRTGLPDVSWGMLYQGIAQSKSQVQSVDDTTGFVNALASVDKRLLDLAGGNAAQLRLQESSAFIEAMSQEMSTGLFYHDTATSPEKFKGLSARYSEYATGSYGKGAANQVINAGGAGSDNTSIWFVTWGERFTHLLYPQNTKAGMQREDKGEQRVLDASGNPYFVKEELFTWHIGMAVNDWRYNARIANIDVSDAQAGSVKLYNFMRSAYYRLQSWRVPGGKQAIYMNRDMIEVLDTLASNAGANDNYVRLNRSEVEGKEVLDYRGIPIRVCDALLNTESLVPAATA